MSTNPSFDDVEGSQFRELENHEEPVVRDHLEETCLLCGKTGKWTSLLRNAKYMVPDGHRLEYIEGGTSLIVIDSCGFNRAL